MHKKNLDYCTDTNFHNLKTCPVNPKFKTRWRLKKRHLKKKFMCLLSTAAYLIWEGSIDHFVTNYQQRVHRAEFLLGIQGILLLKRSSECYRNIGAQIIIHYLPVIIFRHYFPLIISSITLLFLLVSSCPFNKEVRRVMTVFQTAQYAAAVSCTPAAAMS